MNAITIRQPNPSDWGMIQAVANSSFESRKFGIVKVQEAEIKLLMAYENGLPLTSAFQSVHVINGIPALSPKAVWAKIIVHPDFAGMKEERLEENGKFVGYRITLSRKNGISISRSFTLADAKRAALDTKDNWKAWPENMCFWRALGFVEDIVFPDVSLGMNRADELGATITEDGSVIEGSWQTVPARPVVSAATQLQELVNTFGAAAVMEAAGGSIPVTVDELTAVAAILQNRLEALQLDGVEEVKF